MAKQEFNEHCYYVECVEHSEEWHELRNGGIGGSDAASVLGKNPYKNNVTLWEEKTGRKAQDDLSENEKVIFGSKAEEPMRQIYSLKRKKDVQKLNGTLISKRFPFIRVNLDGYIKEDNGLWEGKTATANSYADLQKWKKQLPDQYFTQCLHALLVTGCDYIDLSALIYLNFSTTSEVAQLREYRIYRNDVLEDITYLVNEEIEFWEKVQNDEEPLLKMS